MAKGGTLISAALLVATSTGAFACPPPPPGPQPPPRMAGEDDTAYGSRLEAFREEQLLSKRLAERWWDGYREGWEAGARAAASQIVLVEVIAKGHVDLKRDDGSVYGVSPETTLRVVARADQMDPGQQFSIRYSGMTSCGPTGPVEMAQGNVGDRFLVFAKAGELGGSTLVAGFLAKDLISSSSQAMFRMLDQKSRELP